MRDDWGGIVIGWLAKLALVLALVAAVGFEFVSLGHAKLSVQAVANDAAREAAQNYGHNRDLRRAYQEAVSVASEHDATIRPEEFTIEADGTIRLTVRKTADSSFLHRWDTTKGWLDVDAEAKSRFTS